MGEDRVMVLMNGSERGIYLVRGRRIMLSQDLAWLYGVEPRALVQAIKRNASRFPADFVFQLTAQEYANLKSQTVISSWGGVRRAAPYAFTEHGAVMAAMVLNSPRAVEASVYVVRAFIQLREMAITQKDVAAKLGEIERTLSKHDVAIREVVAAIQQLAALPLEEETEPPRPRIGFRVEEHAAPYRRRKSMNRN